MRETIYPLGRGLIFPLIISIVNFSGAQIDRNIVLTPNLSYQVNGRTLYYENENNNFLHKNKSNNDIFMVPWEQTLKHVTFFAINNHLNDGKSYDFRNNSEYEKFLKSSYIQDYRNYIPKFGDIITLAKGHLERINSSGEYRFIESLCESKNCSTTTSPSLSSYGNENNVGKSLIAYWLVEKIRHHDPDQKFRYELKFSINPAVNNIHNKTESTKRDIVTRNHHQYQRSFILKENDYPSDFTRLDEHISQRRIDENNRYLDKLNRFNQIFTRPKFFPEESETAKVHHYTDTHYPANLNIGEYMPPKVLPPLSQSLSPSYQSQFDQHNVFPAQQHPLFRVPAFFPHQETVPPAGIPLPTKTVPISMQHQIELESYSLKNKNLFPTTYKPNYHLKFIRPTFYEYPSNNNINKFERYPEKGYYPNDDPKEISAASTTHHMHHHYHVTKAHPTETTVYNNGGGMPYLKDHRGALDLIESPSRPTAQSQPQHAYTTHSYYTPSPINNQIPVPPNHVHVSQTPFSIPVGNAIVPAHSIIYMQPVPIHHHIPIYIYSHHNKPPHLDNFSPTKPFIQSPKDERIRYSEPDPLYETRNLYKNENYHNNQEVNPVTIRNEKEENESSFPPIENPIQYENIHQENPIEENESDLGQQDEEVHQVEDQEQQYADSIRAQLPAPPSKSETAVEQNQEENNFYNEELTTLINEEQTIPSTAHLIATTVSTQSYNKNDEKYTPSTFLPTLSKGLFNRNRNISQKSENKIFPKTQNQTQPKTTSKPSELEKRVLMKFRPAVANKYTTTEQPVLKWRPKKIRTHKGFTSVKPHITSPTPKTSNKSSIQRKYEFEKIPLNFTEKIITVTPERFNEISTKQSVSTSISIKVGNEDKERPFKPTLSIPNVELIQANLQNVKTNSSDIKLYRASDKSISPKTEEHDEVELTKSIVEHVKSLN